MSLVPSLDPPPSTPGPAPDTASPAVRVALHGDLVQLGPGLEFTSHGRFTCGADPADADVVVTPPCSSATLLELRRRLAPISALVVLDRAGACTPRQVADLLDHGATTVVVGASARVIAAHIDALIRRRHAGQAPAGRPEDPGRATRPNAAHP